MAGSDALALGNLTLADVAGALALSSGAGWNQTADDWAWFIQQGHAVGFRTPAGLLVATAAALPYGGGLGWISMVLVAPEWRHRGLASLLVENCIQRLQAAHITPVLDATPAGAPVYKHLGFRAGFDLERWEGLGGGGGAGAAARAEASLDESDATARADRSSDARDGAAPADASDVRSADAADLAAIAALDQAANGIGRRALLHNLLARRGSQAWIARDGSGFVVARAGHRATQVGPLVAGGVAGALALLGTARRALTGPVFLDVPTRWSELARHLEQSSFKHQRPYVRMSLGAAVPLACGDRVFVLAGPEFG
jgi:GNAT superfamily N-acetyltransferase